MRANFNLHLKECEFMFNMRDRNIYNLNCNCKLNSR